MIQYHQWRTCEILSILVILIILVRYFVRIKSGHWLLIAITLSTEPLYIFHIYTIGNEIDKNITTKVKVVGYKCTREKSWSRFYPLRFSDLFSKRLGIFGPNFTRPLYIPIYARRQIFIQLPATLMKLCHIKCDNLDHPVHIICSKCPSSAETHAFRRLRKSLIALLSVVCGKLSQICCSALYSSGMVFGFDWSLWNAWNITHHTW